MKKINKEDIDIIETLNDILNFTISSESKRLPKINEIIDLIKNDYKSDFHLKFKKMENSWYFREEYTKYSFYLLTEDFIEHTINYLKENNIKYIIEIGAGSGLLSYWLNKYIKKENLKIKIIAVDLNDKKYKLNHIKKFYPIIEQDGIEFINQNKQKYKNSLYISSWPNYASDFANKILYSINKNDKLLYIGEGYGGCTGDDTFHDNLDKYTKKIYDYKGKSISFEGIYDFPRIFKKLDNFSLLLEDNNSIELS